MSAFSEGMRLGSSSVESAFRYKNDQEDREMRRQKAERDNALLDQQIAEGQRQQRLNAQIDEGNAGIRSFINNGSMTSNGSGFSDDSARLFYDQGGASAVDSAASYGNAEAARLGVERPYTTGATAGRPYDPSNLDDQAGLNRRLMAQAALKGDHQTMLALQDKNKELAETKVFNEAVQQFSTNPDSFNEYTRWVNKNNPMITTSPAKDPRTGQLTGYNIMTVGPAGDATYKFISPAQAAQLAGATALMRVNPTKALTMIAQVDQNLAASIAAQSTAQEKVATTNNQATHFGNEDKVGLENAQSNRITANAHATMAGAAVARANKENQPKSKQIQEEVDAYAGILMKQDPTLKPEDAQRKAYDLVLKNPNAKENPDVGLAEAGLFRLRGSDKVYRLGKGGKPEVVEMPGESKLDRALKDFQGGQGAGSNDTDRGGATPKNSAGIRTPQAAVEGRQYYNTPTSELQRLATKPRGVSSGEANAATEELFRRRGESRLGGF